MQIELSLKGTPFQPPPLQHYHFNLGHFQQENYKLFWILLTWQLEK